MEDGASARNPGTPPGLGSSRKGRKVTRCAPLRCYVSNRDAPPPSCSGHLDLSPAYASPPPESPPLLLSPQSESGAPSGFLTPCSPHHSIWHNQLPSPICLLDPTLLPLRTTPLSRPRAGRRAGSMIYSFISEHRAQSGAQ